MHDGSWQEDTGADGSNLSLRPGGTPSAVLHGSNVTEAGPSEVTQSLKVFFLLFFLF